MGAASIIMRMFDRLSAPGKVHAHCDIPCGVYETDSATHAAQTVHALTEKMLKLEKPADGDMKAKVQFLNSVARMAEVKEKFAHICKQELLILWTDYFKSEHLARYPDLHDNIWKAAKQCSAVKREVNLEAAQKLKEMVAEIAGIFAETKK